MVPKHEWGDGDWLDEPDEYVWIDEATGLRCRISRNLHITGSLNGYVQVPDGVTYSQYRDLHVHGGITWDGNMVFDGSTWNMIGFDTAHAGDLSPLLNYMIKTQSFAKGAVSLRTPYPETYKNFEYVMDQCTYLAKQLRALSCQSP